jgi:uncharacterized protein YdbL (DUF1318 family)
MIKEELLSIIKNYSTEQLNQYIKQLEERIIETSNLVHEVKQIRRKKQRQVIKDNGIRTGD